MDRRKVNGFSLLEVIAAILLLALTFAALMRVGASSLNLTAHAVEYTQTSLRASSMLDKTFVTDFPPAGISTGRFDERYTWRMEVKPWIGQSEADPVRLYRVVLDVLWSAGSQHYSSRFETIRVMPVALRPPPADVNG
jgi:general secretion pathway protein I